MSEKISGFLNGAVVVLIPALLAGCASVVSGITSGLAEDLTSAVLNSEDPQLVRDGAPAYLILMDSFLSGSPEDPDLLVQAATLNTAYASAFVTDPERAKLFAKKALSFSSQAVCILDSSACDLRAQPFEQYSAWVDGLRKKDLETSYNLVISWSSWIQANTDDWNAIADLARVKTLTKKLIELDEGYDNGGPHLMMGVFETLLAPAQGGRPEVGREHFERAIELSEGRYLLVKVMFARLYARLVFDREIHDQLLNEVVAADPVATDLTLVNIIAQSQAQGLLDTADEYF